MFPAHARAVASLVTESGILRDVERNSLRGIGPIRVLIEESGPDAERDGLTRAICADSGRVATSTVRYPSFGYGGSGPLCEHIGCQAHERSCLVNLR